MRGSEKVRCRKCGRACFASASKSARLCARCNSLTSRRGASSEAVMRRADEPRWQERLATGQSQSSPNSASQTSHGQLKPLTIRSGDECMVEQVILHPINVDFETALGD